MNVVYCCSGDREVDVAMTYLFGWVLLDCFAKVVENKTIFFSISGSHLLLVFDSGFSSDFYNGYESEWPLPAGHEQRKTIYNLYHILNHDVLFGGSYIRQAQGMIDQILKFSK